MKLGFSQADRVSRWAILSHAFQIHTDILQLQRKALVQNYKRLNGKRPCSLIHVKLLLIPEHESQNQLNTGCLLV